MRRLIPLLSLVVGPFAASPGPAAAQSPLILQAGPVAVGGYTMDMLATPAAEGIPAYLVIRFDRGPANDRQEHFYGFGRGVHLVFSHGGRAATLTANLGVFGHIAMSLSGTSARRVAVPCGPGRVSGFRGTLGGTLALALHNRVLNGLTLPSRLAADTAAATPSAASACAQPPTAASSGTQLSVTEQLAPTRLATFTATRPATGGTIEDTLVQNSAYLIDDDVTIDDEITASALPRHDLASATDDSSATVIGGGSFMSGSLGYTADAPASGSMPSRGSVSGSLSVRIDGLLTITFPGDAYTSATLGRAQL